MEIARLKQQMNSNYFHIKGKISEDPLKERDENQDLCLSMKIDVVGGNSIMPIPVIFFGSKVDAISTMYAKGDEIEIEGIFAMLYERLVLVAVTHKLINKLTYEQVEEVDRFRKVIDDYSIASVRKRESEDEEESSGD